MKLYVLNVKRYSFTSQTGQEIKGVTATCINDTADVTNDFKGKSTVELKTSELSLWNQFTAVPAFYNVEFSMSTNSKRQTVLKLISANLLQEQKQ
jgi:hypothetical protein